MKKKHIYNFIIVACAVALLCPSSTYAQKKPGTKPATEIKNDTLTILTGKATAGDAAAQNTLGLWYYTGKNVTQDHAAAVKWWAKSADQGNADAIGNLAMCYQLGRGVAQDSVMAIGLYKKAVQKGNKDIVAQHERLAAKKENLFSNALMYELYANGIGVKKNPAKAAAHLEVLAAAGDVERQYKLALYYLNNSQADKAAPWFKAASRQGKTGATYYYGYLLHKGMGIAQDKAKGIRLMEQAEQKGFLAADYQLGKIHLDGDGVEPDAQKGVEYLRKAAPANSNAQWLLGLCYLNGQGVAQDFHFATQWLAEAAPSHEKEFNALLKDDNEGPFSQYLLGLRSYFVDKDYAKALDLFKKVGKAKVTAGETMTAVILSNKDYDKHNPKKAAKMLTKAAAKSPAAAFHLAALYESGTGVKKDGAKALELLQQAAADGVGAAQCRLGDKYMAGDGVTQDYVQAAWLYLQAEAQHQLTPASARQLATCYEKRISSLPDLAHAAQRMEQLRKLNENNRLTTLLKGIQK